MCVLIHRQHRHPVRGIVCQANVLIRLTDSVGKRSSARDDQDGNVTAGISDRAESGIEQLGAHHQAAANFYDRRDWQSGT
jgi:hypothetical protein